MHLVIRERTRALRCVFCKDSLTGEASDRRCGCGAQYHAECYDCLSRCATLGCRRGRIRVQPRQEPAEEETKNPWRYGYFPFLVFSLLSGSPWVAGAVIAVGTVVAVVALIVTLVGWVREETSADPSA